jgi:hypothetical protein
MVCEYGLVGQDQTVKFCTNGQDEKRALASQALLPLEEDDRVNLLGKTGGEGQNRTVDTVIFSSALASDSLSNLHVLFSDLTCYVG